MEHKITTEIRTRLQERGVYADVYEDLGRIIVLLDWEDWKVHVYLKNMLEDMKDAKKISCYGTMEEHGDGSDCFCGKYSVYVR